MTEKRLICTCLCFHLYKKEPTPVTVASEKKEIAFLNTKASAMSNVLFLQDDLFAYQQTSKMDKDALMKEPITSEVQNEEFLDLMPESFVLKAYLRNNSRQISRLALLATMESVTT
ncbi:hypothetical protein PHET_11374 [Paragonimus heterotremus]|uniref:Uncharacterized protein n=1 Tax=Paragonimus heterotremus TaxID=100268 RepID=A0A8J4SYH8_9TREM|nr:hypothetical protein PHET_11374 [Paragonimus heterotremus]